MRILGIELGGYSVKAVEIESRFRKMEVVDLHEVRLPETTTDSTETYKKAISDLIARLPVHPDKIVTSLPAANTSIRFLQVPVKQRKKVEQSFRFELEDAVPFKLEDAIVEHKLSPNNEGHVVVATIAPKRHIQSYLEWLKQVGLDPDWLTFEGMGVINLFLSHQSQKKKEEKESVPVLLLDIGHTKTNISICFEGRLEFFRSLFWGGHSITQSIATGLVMNLSDAEHKKTHVLRLDEEVSVSNTEDEEVISSAVQSLTSLITDLSHSMVAYRTQFKREVGKILLTGGSAKIAGVDEFLTKQLMVPVQFFKPLKEVNYGKSVDSSQEMRFGEALGRALVFNRKSEFLFNFRQEELAKASSFREIGSFLKDPNVITLLKYAGVLAAILLASVFPLRYLAGQAASRAQAELRKVLNETFRDIPNNLRTSLSSDYTLLDQYINQKNNELKQRLKLAVNTQVSMMTMIKTVSDAFPAPPGVEVDVNLLDINDQNLKVDGVLYKGSLNLVLENLKKSQFFKDVTLSQEGQRFTFKGLTVRN